jgi:hypothetical protein
MSLSLARNRIARPSFSQAGPPKRKFSHALSCRIHTGKIAGTATAQNLDKIQDVLALLHFLRCDCTLWCSDTTVKKIMGVLRIFAIYAGTGVFSLIVHTRTHNPEELKQKN